MVVDWKKRATRIPQNPRPTAAPAASPAGPAGGNRLYTLRPARPSAPTTTIAAMNEGLLALQPYPFEKLAAVRASVRPPADRPAIDLSIGEPKHPTPPLVTAALTARLGDTARYPTTAGTPELRAAIAGWIERRFRLPAGAIDPSRQVLPVNGTREALFALAQCVIGREVERPVVLMPNPFYQIYEGAALLAGAEPWYVDCPAANGFQPDFHAVPADVWRRTRLVYLCSPGNPTGATAPPALVTALLERADRHGFVLAADECYSELYADEEAPPPGLLQIAAAAGRSDFRRCIAFHSLSKRSNVPGMRSGFVAGDADLLRDFLRYRTYHGCAMPLYVQAASIAAWNDEEHVRANRAAYRAKYDAVLEILGDALPALRPDGGFYLWPRVPGDDVEFARGLLGAENVCVLPGSFLGRAAHGANPGAGRVRLALVAPLAECAEAARRIRRHVERLCPGAGAA